MGGVIYAGNRPITAILKDGTCFETSNTGQSFLGDIEMKERFQDS